MKTKKWVLIRGGGDLASGVAAVLHRDGWNVVICELAEPLVVRRRVAFAEAVWDGKCQVEEIRASRVTTFEEARAVLDAGEIAVLVDPDLEKADLSVFEAVVDARMLKRYEVNPLDPGTFLIGLGPGFIAGENCDAVVETKRGDKLGSVIWSGAAENDTGIPGIVDGRGLERVLYAPCAGKLEPKVEIGDFVRSGQLLAEVGGCPVRAAFDGMVRGLARRGLKVEKGVKIGDVDPRLDKKLSVTISDKALIVGNAVLSALKKRGVIGEK